MAVDMWQAGQQQRLTELLDTDDEVRNAMPLASVAEAVRQPDLRLAQIVAAVMEGYADRPALGRRAMETVVDESGRQVRRPLPRYETISYRQLWADARAIAAAWHGDGDRVVRPGEFVCSLGFASVDYAALELACLSSGAVAVPLTANARPAQWTSILNEVRPRIVAATLELLDGALDAVLASEAAPHTVMVFDYDAEDHAAAEAVDSARRRLADADSTVVLEPLQTMLERGRELPAAPLHVPKPDENPLAQIIYTSGSTGEPKGAMFPERLLSAMWRGVAQAQMPAIVLNYMPLSHTAGRMVLMGGLARGGTSYFVTRNDMSTLLADISLVRPTEVFFIPRVCELVLDRCRTEVSGREAQGLDHVDADRVARAEVRDKVMGGRVVSAVCGSAPLDADVREQMESTLEVPLHDTYGTTEAGAVMLNNRLQRPPVLEYKLADVPELGYFATDKPHPRGELLLKTASMIPGYYNRPELNAEIFDADGFYRTGDVMAETAPDELEFVDRRNNVVKLAQAEFVTVAKLEEAYEGSPLIHQAYVYGRSGRPHLLAVLVPTEEAQHTYPDDAALKSAIAESMHKIAKDADLHAYEIPRDFLVETEPFTVDNGLVSDLGKLLRPKLNDRYAEQLEQLYVALDDEKAGELAALRREAANRPVLESVMRATQTLLGNTATQLRPDSHFSDLGGDSLTALSLSTLLGDVFDIEVPVSVIVGPAADLEHVADFVETERESGSSRPTATSLHGHGSQIRASELTLDAFIDSATLAAAPAAQAPAQTPRTVLLTGANGYLGRFLALEWLQRLETTGGRLICLVRGGDVAGARERLDAAFDTGDPELLSRYQELSEGRLEVLAGDTGRPRLGLSDADWQHLTDDVDAIVHPAAQVNHVLPYGQLFGPNVSGTAEVIRLAISSRLKPVTYVSTVGVADQIGNQTLDEDADIRELSPIREVTDGYANGYANSKWAAEVLLRTAHDQCSLPVTVFRSNMILAHSRYAGQLNVPDMFTRLLYSLLLAGVAPASFYRTDDDGNRQQAHYDGVPVDFTAEAIVALGARADAGYRTFNLVNQRDDGVGLDEFVDWLIDSGHRLDRIADYSDWLSRFEIALRRLPDHQIQQSVLPLLDALARPEDPIPPFAVSARQFESAASAANVGAGDGIPRLSRELITKYVSDLRVLGLVEAATVKS